MKRDPEKKKTAAPQEEERKAAPKASSKEGKLVRPPSAKKGEKAGPKVIKESGPRVDEEEDDAQPTGKNNLAINDIDSKAHGEFVRQALDDAKQASAAETTKEKPDNNPGIKMTSLRGRKAAQQETKAKESLAGKEGPRIGESQPSSIPSANDVSSFLVKKPGLLGSDRLSMSKPFFRASPRTPTLLGGLWSFWETTSTK